MLISQNSIAYPVVFMAVLMASGIFSKVSPTLPVVQLIKQARELSPAFIFASQDTMSNANKTASEIGLDDSRLFPFDRENFVHRIHA